jgi:hypothetical protein
LIARIRAARRLQQRKRFSGPGLSSGLQWWEEIYSIIYISVAVSCFVWTRPSNLREERRRVAGAGSLALLGLLGLLVGNGPIKLIKYYSSNFGDARGVPSFKYVSWNRVLHREALLVSQLQAVLPMAQAYPCIHIHVPSCRN